MVSVTSKWEIPGSVTPNLRTYLVRTNGGSWQTIRDCKFRWKLELGKNTLDVRTQNRFEVIGPTVTATVLFKPAKAVNHD